jgi:hypothetical protein
MILRVRFSKEFTLTVSAGSREEAEAAANLTARAGLVDDMDGGGEWSAETWIAPNWDQMRRPDAVVRKDVLVHPTDPEDR